MSMERRLRKYAYLYLADLMDDMEAEEATVEEFMKNHDYRIKYEEVSDGSVVDAFLTIYDCCWEVEAKFRANIAR